MSMSGDQLERLISRFLDGEASPEESRVLNEELRTSPAARVLYEDLAALDREAGQVLRSALGRAHRAPQQRPRRWVTAGRIATAAAAACLAFVIWHRSDGEARDTAPPHRATNQAGAMSSWFAPPAETTELVASSQPEYVRPSVRLDNTEREWILVPTERPGEYLMVEIDRTQTELVRIQRDL